MIEFETGMMIIYGRKIKIKFGSGAIHDLIRASDND